MDSQATQPTEADGPLWRQYELAVAQFLKAAGPNAKIIHDARQPDPDTGSSRQRDVWVEIDLCGLPKIKALVSCKRWSTKLDALDIEQFYGEFFASNAHVGIIYSYLGFTDTAIVKATDLGRGRIHCCQLFVDQPSEIPAALILKDYYCVKPVAGFVLREKPDSGLKIENWEDVFALTPTVRKEIKDAIKAMVDAANDAIKEKPGFPPSHACDFDISDAQEEFPPVKCRLMSSWKIYEGDVTAVLLDGSYSLTENRFVGSQSGPWIDTKGETPGPAWKLLKSQPEFPKSGMISIFFGGIQDSELDKIAAKPVTVVSG